ncbi:MAG: LamG-like jellyroll fold domain-containing protein [Rhodospirillaceae bacterium]
MSSGTWTNLVLVRTGTTLTCYKAVSGGGNNIVSATTVTGVSGTMTDVLGFIGRNATSAANYLNGYLNGLRLSNTNRGYTAPWTPSTIPFVADGNTLLLLNGQANNPDQSSTNANLTWNAVTTTLGKFNNSSLILDGVSGKVICPTGAPFQFSGDFTVDLEFYSIAQTDRVLFGGASGVTTGIVFMMRNSGTILCYYNGSPLCESTVIVPLNCWNHLEYTRSGTTLTIRLNGIQIATATLSANLSDGVAYIGCKSDSTWFFGGMLDEVRVSNIYRHAAPFVPPVTEYGGTAATCTLKSNNLATTLNPTSGVIVARVQDLSGTMVLNTDLIGELTEDGGTTWTAAILADGGPWNYAADSRIIYGSAVLAGSGNNFAARLRTANGKSTKIKALAAYGA